MLILCTGCILIRKNFLNSTQAQHIDPKEVFKTEAEIDQIKENMKKKAAQPQPPDTKIQVAQMQRKQILLRYKRKTKAIWQNYNSKHKLLK